MRGTMVRGRAGWRCGGERAKKIGGSLQNLAPPRWHPQPVELGSLGVPSTGGGQSHSSEAEPGLNGVAVGRRTREEGNCCKLKYPQGQVLHVSEVVW